MIGTSSSRYYGTDFLSLEFFQIFKEAYLEYFFKNHYKTKKCNCAFIQYREIYLALKLLMTGENEDDIKFIMYLKIRNDSEYINCR